MRYLLDTQLLLWLTFKSWRLPGTVQAMIADPEVDLLFSVASLIEVAIKFALGRPDFPFPPAVLRSSLIAGGYRELDVLASHAMHLAQLPMIHRDPFDRLLVAQTIAEGLILLTTDQTLATYPAPVQRV